MRLLDNEPNITVQALWAPANQADTWNSHVNSHEFVPPFGLEAIAIRLEAVAIRLEAIAIRLEAIATRLQAIAIRLEAIAIRLEAITIY